MKCGTLTVKAACVQDWAGEFAEKTKKSRKLCSKLMKLYTHPMSTFSRRVRMQLLEKGVSVDEVIVDMQKREHKGEAYRALNPYGRVPTLVDGDFVLFESSAIMEYLERLFPAPPLVPMSVQGRARVSMHIKLCDLELGVHTSTLIFPRRFLPRERWNLRVQAEAIEAVGRHLAVLEQVLGDRSYLVEDQYSLADLAYTPFLSFLALIEVAPPPHVAAWVERLQARPSALATRPNG
jgi:glutathione S-transferase